MKTILLKLEPIIWFMFGQGIMIGTMLLTGWILVLGILMPLGIVDPMELNYVRAEQLFTTSLLGIPVAQLLLAALVVLPLWKGAHHMRHLSIDFGGGERDALVAPLLYALAAAGSLLALVAALRL